MGTTRLLLKLRLLSEMLAVITEREFALVTGEFFHEFLARGLRNLNGILIFMCYPWYQVEVVRQLSRMLGTERARKIEGLAAERG